jgi:hypothetical protein
MASNNPIWLNYRRTKTRNFGLNEPIMMSVKAELTDRYVCQALASDSASRTLRGLKLDLPGLGEQELQVLDPEVELNAESIRIDSILVTKGASPSTGVRITISAMPELQGSKVVLQNMHVSSPDIEDPTAFAKFISDLFNPIFDFGKFDRGDHAFRLTSFNLEPGKIVGNGYLLVVGKKFERIAQNSQPAK